MIRFLLIKDEKTVEVKLEGDLDIDGTEVVEEELLPAIEKFSSVTLNLRDVPFVDSSGIGLLLNLVKTMEEKGITIVITNVREEVMDVFDLLQIPDILGEGVFI
ncbi:STAS domain-containing protein [Bacillus sp. JJ1533]|uniref:STAS domain-containing protein n=1 Tax=Bacillus sp. JJ1533 TaxID=3122959 RepID=UPI002FFEBD9E